MKNLVELKVLKINVASDAQKQKGIVSVVVTQIKKITDGLEEIVNVKLKSKIAIPENLLSKTIVADVELVAYVDGRSAKISYTLIGYKAV